MTDSNYSRFGQGELLQLAMQATAAGDGAAAIACLEEAVARLDATAAAHYLLGAELAQAREYERAIGEMEAALALDPALAIVRIQLGLLWMGQNGAAKARAALLPLLELPRDGYLHLFGAGLLALIGDRLEEAARLLTEGQAVNTENLPLNGDMQRIVQAIADARPAEPAPADEKAKQAGAEEASEADLRHVLLSAYMGNVRH